MYQSAHLKASTVLFYRWFLVVMLGAIETILTILAKMQISLLQSPICQARLYILLTSRTLYLWCGILLRYAFTMICLVILMHSIYKHYPKLECFTWSFKSYGRGLLAEAFMGTQIMCWDVFHYVW